MQYEQLGSSDLHVSRLNLGLGNLGSKHGPHWTMSRGEAISLISLAFDHGINFFDTANIYNAGESEQWFGQIIKSKPIRRDQIYIATKCGYRMDPRDPRGGGLGRQAIIDSVEGSLKRLGTDYIDLMYIHLWDCETPVEETMQTMAFLIAEGKIRNFGFSNVPAWYAGMAVGISRSENRVGPVAFQMNYNLLERQVEFEFLKLALKHRIGFVSWGPLANGVLSGRYDIDLKSRKLTGTGRMTASFPMGQTDYFAESVPKVLNILNEISEREKLSCAQTALAWLLAQPGMTSISIGVATTAQLTENLKCLDFKMSKQDIADLNQVSQPKIFYPYGFFTPKMQELVSGKRTMNP